MYVLLCPRCGLPIAYIGRERHRPYWKDCGWNLKLVTDKQRHFFPGMTIDRNRPAGLPLMPRCTTFHGMRFSGLGTVTAAGVFGIRNNTSRTNNLLRAVASKPGAELSSATPENHVRQSDRLRGISQIPCPALVRLG
jgi:hypothetical protein